MRPLKLTIAGLQSYREPQTVDFGQLFGAGVFGIFGPTGSGKSSILDGMTLALFGEVGRASKGTQGILNHAEKALSVSFSFELSEGKDVETYVVERQYKRDGDHGVKSAVARLIRVLPDGTRTVLADKTREVNAGVVNILGLSMSDFTRAVVLPQGKFAEFLQLTGADRRQMLQRLFHLHPYGDGLAARLQARRQEAEAHLRELTAERQALGDASEEAVAAAGERLGAARQAAAEARAAAEAAERAYRDSSEALERRRKLDEAKRQLATLESHEPELRLTESALERAERAEAILPDWRERQQADASRESAGRGAGAARESARAASAAELAGRSAREVARSEAAEQLPLLNKRQSELEQAIACGEELKRVEEAAAALRRQVAVDAEQADRAQEELAALRGKREKAIRLQGELRAELESLAVAADERDKLRQAVVALERRERLAADAAAAVAELAGRSQLIEAVREQAAAGERTAAQLGESLLHEARLVWTLRSELTGVSAEVQTAEQATKQREASIRELLRASETAKLAGRLAESLVPGEPCPVCGSAHHPALDAGVHADEGPAAEAGAGAEGAVRTAVGAGTEAEGAARTAREKAEAASPEDDLRELEVLVAREQERLREIGLEARAELLRADALLRELGTRLPESLRDSWLEAAAGSVAEVRVESADGPDADSAVGAAIVDEVIAAATAVPASGDTEGFRSPATFGEAGGLGGIATRLAERLTDWRGRYAACETAVEQSKAQLEASARERESLHAQLRAAESVYEERQAASNELQGKLAESDRAWASEWPELATDRVRPEWERLAQQDREAEKLRERLTNSEPYIRQTEEAIGQLESRLAEVERSRVQAATMLEARDERLAELKAELQRLGGENADDPAAAIRVVAGRIIALTDQQQRAEQAWEAARTALQQAEAKCAAAEQALAEAEARLARAEERWQASLAKSAFESGEQAQAAWMPEADRQAKREQLDAWRRQLAEASARCAQLAEMSAADPVVSDEMLEAARIRHVETAQAHEQGLALAAKCERDLESCTERHRLWKENERQLADQQQSVSRLQRLAQVLRGNAFVEFIAEEQLAHVSRSASERLGRLTRGRYALELDSGGGFIIRDDANGGVRRPVSSLSGGETFLTSLALALALSSQIQLRGRHPLQFFFLDEGFGTLDPELLDTVVSALESLQSDSMAVGVISHVPELRARLARKLVVHPAEPSGRGSRLVLETL